MRDVVGEELLDAGAEGIVGFVGRGGGGGDGEVEFLLRGVFDVGVEVGEVGGGLEVDFTVVGVHCCWMFCTDRCEDERMMSKIAASLIHRHLLGWAACISIFMRRCLPLAVSTLPRLARGTAAMSYS